MIKNIQTINLTAPRKALRLGFVPLTDCAPLVVARELGLFRKYGLNVVLHRELGWAAIRDKIITGELDAAQAVAGMPFAATLGLGSARCECVTGLVLNLHGNAITLSNELWRHGVRDAATLREFIHAKHYEHRLTFGVVFLFSSHHFLLRDWLTAAGINPDKDVRIVVVPPPQMPGALQAGHIDGCCVGEPWNSVAVQSRAGWVAATSAELAPDHPEKILTVRRDFAEHCADEHEALIAALLAACEFCDAPENHATVLEMLSRREFLDRAPAMLRPGLTGEFDFGHGQTRQVQDFVTFHRDDANEPSADKAAWVIRHLRAANLATPAELTPSLARSVFRCDIYDRACALRTSIQTNHENKTNESKLVLA
ncbi:MAG: CmpA/NrtA family ABC transporter substrate-binding protein [Verrucomicrobia bacterium]|nr:CmpA/NrtA family ABC transporter substrate-binding protein [Verrucomicrobiota bacterium]